MKLYPPGGAVLILPPYPRGEIYSGEKANKSCIHTHYTMYILKYMHTHASRRREEKKIDEQ